MHNCKRTDSFQQLVVSLGFKPPLKHIQALCCSLQLSLQLGSLILLVLCCSGSLHCQSSKGFLPGTTRTS